MIADEAHRRQYDFIDGFARHMRDALPNVSFIGFTGTPIELTDKNTRAVFGDYISIYDIQRAVEDKAIVPIYYESRLAKLELDQAERPRIDPDFEEATEGEEGAIEAAQMIEEMIAIAKDMRRASERGATLKLGEEELAFYDALETNDSAVQVLGDETLRTITREVTDAVRKNVTIDWTMRENVRAQLRVIVKRILRKYGYPPDKQEKATQTVLEQVELLGWEVAA